MGDPEDEDMALLSLSTSCAQVNADGWKSLGHNDILTRHRNQGKTGPSSKLGREEEGCLTKYLCGVT